MSFEFSVLVRSSIILFATTLLVPMLRKASASTRHTIWLIGLSAALVLPLVAPLLPAINLPVFLDSKTPLGGSVAEAPVSTIVLEPMPVLTSNVESRSESKAAVVSGTMPAGNTMPKPVAQSLSRRQWLMLVWALGIAAVLFRASLGFREVRTLEADSHRMVDDASRHLLAALKTTLSISAPVELRIGGDAIPPMTWGIFRHAILFPSVASEWSEDRIRVVIAHELAHVKRRDGLAQLMIQAACAIYWFNPLAWYAAYRMRIERECACDDQVLNFGVDPDDYAEQLLGIARVVNTGSAIAALAMVDGSHFETRLRAILDATRNRRMLSGRSTASLLCLAALLTVLVGTTHLTIFAMPAAPQTRVAAVPTPEPMMSVQPPVPSQQSRSANTAVLVGMDFIRIAPGTFMMGCSPGDSDCKDDEKPAHRVRITKSFEIGKDEVTQAQWQIVMGDNPSSTKGADLPVETVAWDDVQAFLQKLNGRNDGYRYRLPTEAEWEYAARAGSAAAVPASLDTIAWYANNSGKASLDSVVLWKTDQRGFGPRLRDNENHTHAVGQKSANAWGLHDMLGNVQEMVQDWYAPSYYQYYPNGYQSGPVSDPVGPPNGSQHVARGGCYGSSGLNSDSTARVSSRTRFVDRRNSGLSDVARALLDEIATGKLDDVSLQAMLNDFIKGGGTPEDAATIRALYEVLVSGSFQSVKDAAWAKTMEELALKAKKTNGDKALPLVGNPLGNPTIGFRVAREAATSHVVPVVFEPQLTPKSPASTLAAARFSDLVWVNATVWDAEGHLVTGLKPGNFHVWEDGIEANVAGFEEWPLSVGLVMGGLASNDTNTARDAAVNLLKAGSPDDEYFLEGLNRGNLDLLQDFTTDISKIQKQRIREDQGPGEIFDGMYLGIQKLRDAKNPRRALVVLVAGDDSHSRYTLANVKGIAVAEKVQVFTIAIRMSAEGRTGMEDLAGVTAGRAFFPASVGELDDIFAKIAVELKHQYMIGYRSANLNNDGQWRSIKIRVNPPAGMSDLTVRSRAGYYASKQ